jgi:flavin reductase (DIM6/NTAB) family NADH-FMN oxidoreductase RutF
MSSEQSGMRQNPVDADEFRAACGRFATGVAIASVMDGAGVPHGLTISSFTSVSLDPPLILVCVGHLVTSIDVFRAAPHFGISVLHESQREIAQMFARKGEDRFGALKWRPGVTGAPLLEGALAEMEIQVVRRISAGDHDIFIGEMVRGAVRDGKPLIYFASRFESLAGR